MKILVIQTSFLGDVVLSTPVLSSIRAWSPNAEITVMTTPAAESLVRYHPAVNAVIVFDKRKSAGGLRGLLQMVQRIRDEQFDVIFSLHKSWRTAVLVLLSRVPLRFGFSEAKLKFVYTKTASRKGFEHEVLRNLAVMNAVNFPREQWHQEMCIGISEDVRQRATQLLAGLTSGQTIGIAPGSVWATKRWTADGFAEVTQQLVKKNIAVVLLGGPEDSSIGEAVEKQAGVAVLNLVGKTDLLTSVAVIEKLDALITNDSSPLHMASAVKTPVVALFCATVPEFGFGPWQVRHEIVEVVGLSCKPCGRHGGMICPTGTHACQKGLLPSWVVAAVERVLRAAPVCSTNCISG